MESTGNSNFWTISSEQGDSSSAEEVESPRSVVTSARTAGGRRDPIKINRNKKSAGYMHSQVLRIKEEELQIGEDFYDQSHEYVASAHPLDDRIVIWSRAILPASPLGVKNNNRRD